MGYQTVVVGYDGSPHADGAVEAAADQVGADGTVHVVTAFHPESTADVMRRLKELPEEYRYVWDPHTAEKERQHAALARLRERGVGYAAHVVAADAATAILDVARREQADLVVVGSRGLGGFLGLLLGSVSVKVASHAPCPVVVVRSRDDDDRPAGGPARVVVGVDGSDVSALAVGFAFETAARRGLALTAVRAWEAPAPMDPALLSFLPKVEEEEMRELVASLAGERRRFPDVDVRVELVNGHPAQALVAASDEAEVVVVGSRGRGGLAGMLLGSVSQAVLQHAHGPVAVVRGPS
ncbi:universal stress protein [Aquipuribacter sp. MA13-6]|uniref:universal stress protein n=1 Tax=unclassified Aquipuribacter TaxID=2635084 RepID=UPI003EE826F6